MFEYNLNFCLLLLLGIFLITYTSCESNEPVTDQEIDNELNIEKSIYELAILIAKASGDNIEFRRSIKGEISKKFDYDYNALLLSFIGRDINGEKFEDILAKFSGNKYSPNDIIQLIENSGYLQLSIPVHFDDYKPDHFSPLIVAIPVDADEKTSVEFDAYRSDGTSIKISAISKPEEPVIVIMQSERVDKDGYVKVDEFGFVLPNESRLHYMDAIKISEYQNDNKVKSSGNKLIEIVSDEEYQIFLSDSKGSLSTNYNNLSYETVDEDISLKSTNSNIYYLNAAAKASRQVELTWQGYPGANIFKIYRTGYANVGGIKQLDPNKLIYTLSNTYTVTDVVDFNNEEYTYYVQYYNGSTFIAESNYVQIHSSHRKNNGMEYVARIKASESMVSYLEGWWCSELELHCNIVYKNYEGLTSDRKYGFQIPTSGRGRTRPVNWTGVKNLFRWDRAGYDYGAYTFVLSEEDGGSDTEDLNNIAIDWVKFVTVTFLNLHGIQAEKMVEKVATNVKETIRILKRSEYIGQGIVKWWDPDGDFKELNSRGFSIIINHNPN